VDTVGIGFLFAAASSGDEGGDGPRREIASAPSSICWPLTNPAGATRQVDGVYRGALCALAQARSGTGQERALILYGEIGLDEISTWAGSMSVNS